MKPVKNFVFATLLVSAFAVNAFAGDQETPGYCSPPPPSHSVPTTSTGTQGSNQAAQDQANSSTNESDNLLFDVLAAILSSLF